ncbi:DUF1707 SHOCT-like domain-containing protein [Nonomuraea recticatena]|uniref:DUF1707 SHOCT-like domain-containing protein n=1 Tax=Nonomuraea recticatena TaxID=46178 RepID=UPI0036143D31
MPADPPSSPALRASDTDRDLVIEQLRAAVADGRLDPVEFDERLDAALTARTIDALAPLITDLIAVRGGDGTLTLPFAGTPAEPAAELLTIHERHGSVRREGRWTLPHRLALRTAWCDVMLDLTSAVRSAPNWSSSYRCAAAPWSWSSHRAWWWTPTSCRCGTAVWESAGTQATTHQRHCTSAW